MTSMLAALLALTLGIVAGVPSASAQDNLTVDKIAGMSPEEMRAAPAVPFLRSFPDSPPREEFYLALQYALHVLGFYEGLPNGKEDTRMKAAVRTFRAARGESVADVLSIGDVGELAARVALFEPDRFHFKRSFWYDPPSDRETVGVNGTWVNRPLQDKADYAGYFGLRNYIEISCDRKKMTCREMRLNINWGGEHGYLLELKQVSFAMTISKRERIVAIDRSADCYTLTLTIDFAAKRAEQRVDHHKKQHCPNEKGDMEPYYYNLISPETLFGPGWDEDKKRRGEALSPELRTLTERVRSGRAWELIGVLAGFR
ncbi:MAG: hypothetical protein WD039_04440 [Xanthobacteraceae bacterium]